MLPPHNYPARISRKSMRSSLKMGVCSSKRATLTGHPPHPSSLRQPVQPHPTHAMLTFPPNTPESRGGRSAVVLFKPLRVCWYSDRKKATAVITAVLSAVYEYHSVNTPAVRLQVGHVVPLLCPTTESLRCNSDTSLYQPLHVPTTQCALLYISVNVYG